jgi:hypothetical protein
LRPKRINYEFINKLAGYGPYCSEGPTRANMQRLADPIVPLSERIRLLQAIAGGPLHYEHAADCLDEDPERVMRSKALVLAENPHLRQEHLTDNVTAYFQFDFAAPHTQRDAIAACYRDRIIDARDVGIRAGRKALREAGIQGHAAELWIVQVPTYSSNEWLIQDEKTRRWHVAKDDEWMSLQLVTQRPGNAREALAIAFDCSFPAAHRVAEIQDTALLEPFDGIRAEAWLLDAADRHPTWAVLRKGGCWKLASLSWQHALNQVIQYNPTTE